MYKICLDNNDESTAEMLHLSFVYLKDYYIRKGFPYVDTLILYKFNNKSQV